MLRTEFTIQEYLRDPAPALAELRAAGPVVEVRFPIIGRIWITTTSDLAGRVLKDSETFTMRKDGKLAGLRWWIPGGTCTHWRAPPLHGAHPGQTFSAC